LTIGFMVDIEFAWGFQARVIGLSKTNPSFLYPPPTTFLGALSEAIAKNLGFSEFNGKTIMENLSRELLAIGWKPLNCRPVRYEDINRVIAIRIVGKTGLYPTPKNLSGSFDSPARGKTSLYSLDDKAPTIRWFLVFKNEAIKIGENSIELEDNFWRIHRIGSKESRVSVVNVKGFTPEIKSGAIKTNYATLLDFGIIDLVEGEWVIENYLNPFDPESFKNPLQSYFEKTIKFMCPMPRWGYPIIDIPFIRVKLAEDAKAYVYEKEAIIGYANRN